MKIGNVNITKIKLGIPQIIKVFRGIDLVWSRFLVIIDDFKARVLGNQGQFEGETCLNTTLENMGIDLFDQASLVTTPNAYEESILYSVTPNDGTGEFTVVRATTGTRVNSDGLVEMVPYNLFSQSQTFENSFWFKEASTVTANNITSPSGLMDADYIQETSVLGSHGLRQGTPLNSTNIHTYSVYIKQNGRPGIIFRFGDISNNNQGSYIGANTFIYSTKTITGTFPANVIELSNGWFRVEIQVTPISARLGVSHWSYNGVTDYYVGDTSKGFYIWGAQLVEGTEPKPYYPTTNRLNIPRLDYSNGCPSLLVEPQRTNLLVRSEEFENSSWVKGAMGVITSNATTAPNGLLTADEIFPLNSGGSHFLYQSVTNNTVTQIASCYFKASEYTRCGIRFNDNNTNQGQIFDLTTGQVVSSVGTKTTGIITNVGNGWYRCEVTITLPTNLMNVQFCIIDNSSTVFEFTGVVTSGLYIWGAQLELGSNATSYIPTTSAAVTRNEDQIYNNNLPLSVIPNDRGTMYCEVFKNTTSLSQASVLGTNPEYLFFNLSNDSFRVEFRLDGGVIPTKYGYSSGTAPKSNGVHKLLLTFGDEVINFYCDGEFITSRAYSGNFKFHEVADGNRLNLSRLPGSIGTNRSLEIRSIIIYKTILSEDEAINLTTL